MDLKNILVATDLSDHCGKAAAWAQAFKERVGAEQLVVAHVIELSLTSWVKSAFEVLDDDAHRAAAEKEVATWFEQHSGARPDRIELRAGSCLAQLTEIVGGLEGETLIVVSMSGKSAVTRFFLGSTAHSLASRPPCAVAIVHPEHVTLSNTSVVTGTDLSRNGKHAVAYAASVARHLDVPLEIVHAYGPPNSPVVSIEPAAEATMIKIAKKKIDEQPGLEGVEFNVHIVPEIPGDAIVGHAARIGADLIVLGHSGESVFVQNVLGSVTQRVLGHMGCNMIVVPAVGYDDPDFQDDEEE